MNKSWLTHLLILCLMAGCRGAAGPSSSIPTAQPLTAVPIRTSSPTPQPPPPTASGSPTAFPSLTATSLPAASLTPAAPLPQPSPTPLTSASLSSLTNVYAGPGLDYPLLAVLTAGFQVQLAGADASGTWLAVLLPRGLTGWLQSGQLVAGSAPAGLPLVDPPQKPPPTATETPEPSVVIEPIAMAPGAEYSIILLDFGPRELVTVKVLFAEDGRVEFKTTVRMRNDGSALLSFTTSSLADHGTYILTAGGDQGSEAEAVFYVGPPP